MDDPMFDRLQDETLSDLPEHTFLWNTGVKVGQRVEVPGFYIDRSGDSANHKIFYINANT